MPDPDEGRASTPGAAPSEVTAHRGDDATRAGSVFRPGERVSHYEVIALLGRGGMGEVYRARDLSGGREVAVKVLSPVGDESDRAALVQRFLREGRNAARIDHPGVVKVLACESSSARPILVMDYVAGESLKTRLLAGPLPPGRALDLAARLADALAAAHAKGVVHRDLKPANILIDTVGMPRIVDFGISRYLEETQKLTRTGDLVGTPEYMAPEQLLEGPEAVDGRVDVYALGVVLYQMLTGRSPFAGANVFQTLKFVEMLEPPPVSRSLAGASPALDSLLGRAMAKSPAERFPDAGSFAAAIREVGKIPGAASATDDAARRSRPGRAGVRVALAIGAALAAGLGAWAAFGPRPDRAGSGAIAGGNSPANTPVPGNRPVGNQNPAAVLHHDPGARLDAALALRAPEERNARVRALNALVATVPDDGAPGELRARATARLALADFTRAEADAAAAAARGDDAARTVRAIAWLYSRTLLTAILADAEWLRLDAFADLRPVLGEADPDPARRHFHAGCQELAQKRYVSAADRFRLAQGLPQVVPDREALLATALWLSDDVAGARGAVAEGLARDPSYPPLLLMEARLDDRWVLGPALAPFLEMASVESADRYLVAAVASCEAEDRASMEAQFALAAERERGPRPAVWRAALRLRLGAYESPSTGIPESEARALLVPLERIEDAGPGARFTRVLLRLAAGVDPGSAQELKGIPLEPEIAQFEGWGEVGGPEDPEWGYYLGHGLLAAGRPAQAQETLRRFVEAATEAAAEGEEIEDLEEALHLSHEALAATALLLGTPSLGESRAAAAVHLGEALRRGSDLAAFRSALDPIWHRERDRLVLQDVVVRAARRTKDAGLSLERVLPALHLARRIGVSWDSIREDASWGAWRDDARFRKLAAVEEDVHDE